MEEVKNEVAAAERVHGNRVNTAVLPMVDMAKVVVARNKATDDRKGYRATGFSVLVFVNGKWRLENDVLHHYGIKSRTAVFTTYERAKEEVAKVKSTWGVEVKAAARKSRKLTPAERVAKMTPEEREAYLAALMAK